MTLFELIDTYIDENLDSSIVELSKYCAIPSVAAQGGELKNVRRWQLIC